MRENKTNQVDPEEISLLIQLLEQTIKDNVNGDVVELGCYEGTTSLILQDTLTKKAPHKRLYVYDSFEGLPEKSQNDQSPAGLQFKAGELTASKKLLIRQIRQSNLPQPNITKAWFSELRATDMPSCICFAFLDGDYYDSIMDSLKLIWDATTKGGIIVVDDYINEALPGAKKAVDEWLATHEHSSFKNCASMAIIRK